MIITCSVCYLNCLGRVVLAHPFWALATFWVCLPVLDCWTNRTNMCTEWSIWIWGWGGKQNKRTMYSLHNDNFMSRGLQRTNKKTLYHWELLSKRPRLGSYYTQSVIQGLTKSVCVFCEMWVACSTIAEDSSLRDVSHSFHWHVQNATIPCRSQQLLPFLSVMYFFLPPFSTNYSSILSHPILPSISWSPSQSCSQIHI